MLNEEKEEYKIKKTTCLNNMKKFRFLIRGTDTCSGMETEVVQARIPIRLKLIQMKGDMGTQHKSGSNPVHK